MRVLIVDDDNDKVRSITRVLESAGVSEGDNIDLASTVTQAADLLRKSTYDLLILDLYLPVRLQDEPSIDGGCRLLNEIVRRDDLYRPEHIVGLTVSEDARRLAEPEFSRGLWSISLYGPHTSEWKEQIHEKARYLVARKAAQDVGPTRRCDALIICALAKPELSQLKAASGTEWQQFVIPGDATSYFSTEIERDDAQRLSLVACASPMMGMTAAATLTTKACLHFRPRMVLMTGICAGRKGEVNLGDVVVGSTTWDYGSGKFKGTNGSVEFTADPYQIPIDPQVRLTTERVISDTAFLSSVQTRFTGGDVSNKLRAVLAPIASGAAVQAHSSFFSELAKRDRKVAAVDMEAFGVCWAAREVYEPHPTFCVVKGVCDFADEEKSDDMQSYCAYVSACIALQIVKTYPPT